MLCIARPDTASSFRQRRFEAHWFETGTPTFLVKLLVERGIGSPQLDGMETTGDVLAAFDVDDTSTEALLFQGGYLTIVDVDVENDEPVYRVGYPNRVVRESLNRLIDVAFSRQTRNVATFEVARA